MSDNKNTLSITNENVDISDVLEPITTIPLQVANEKAELTKAIKGIKNFFNTDYEKNNPETEHLIPYFYDPDNQSIFTEFEGTISDSLANVLELAKNMRQELYIAPNDSKPQFQVPDAIEPQPAPGQQEKPKGNFISKALKKSKTDPNNPLAKMEKSIRSIEYIQTEIWEEALGWHETNVAEAKLMKKGHVGIQTKDAMEIEGATWAAIFGYHINPNIRIAFGYGSKLRIKDAERYAVDIAKTRRDQEEKDKAREFTTSIK